MNIRRPLLPSIARLTRSAPLAFAAGLVELGACGGGEAAVTPPPPSNAPTIRVVSGGRLSDTIYAGLAPLIVQVTDAANRPIAGTVVRFTADTTRLPQAWIVPGWAGALPSKDATTDADGKANLTRFLNGAAGEAITMFTAPAIGVSGADTVRIRAGAAAKIRIAADTAVYLGGTIQLASSMTDRGGNLVGGTIAFTGSNAEASVSPTGLVSGLGFGETNVVASSGTIKSASHVAVMPRGTISAIEFRATTLTGPGAIVSDLMPYVVSMDLDLSSQRSLGTTLKNSICFDCSRPRALPRWTADGSRIVFTAGTVNGKDTARVMITDQSGAPRVLIGPPTFTWSVDAVASNDGAWIHFAGWASGSSRFKLWRARIDGTDALQLPDAIPAEVGGERAPSLSPDGTMIVYTADLSDQSGVRIHARNVATGQRTSLNVNGSSPRWAPTGDLIAYRASGELRLVRSDGSGDRRLGAGAVAGDFSWSPDGKYLATDIIGGIAVIEVATGRMVRLISDGRFEQPAWRP